MTRGGTSTASFFAGPQKLATADDLDAFVRRAQPQESFVYCEAPDLIQGETSARVATLAGEGLVRPHRSRRQGGGWTFIIVRTSKGLAKARDPQEEALADRATETIYRALKRAANVGQPCPSDADLAAAAGLTSRHQAAWRVRRLIDAELIGSTLAYDCGVPARVVTIAASRHAGAAADKFTALPKKWRALREAAERELRAADEADLKRLRGAGAL